MSFCNSCEDVFMFQRLGSDLAFSLDKLYFFLYLFCICGVKIYLCFSVWGQNGQVSNANLALSLGKFYFHSIAYNMTVPKVTFKYSSLLSVDTSTHHKPSKIVESHPQKDVQIQMLEG